MLSKQQQKEVALRRLEQLGLKKSGLDTLKVFEKDNTVYFSEPTPLCGALYTLDDDIKLKVTEFENRTGGLVYHVIHTYTEFGNLWAFLYVGNDEEDLEYDEECMKYDLEAIKRGERNDIQIMSYVYNADFEDCSEYGYILVREFNGGLIRIA